MLQAKRADRTAQRAFDLPLDGCWQARRRDIDGLFKIGAGERIRLIEDGEQLEFAALDHRFDCDLNAINVLLDLDELTAAFPQCANLRRAQQRVDAVESSLGFFLVVGANDASAAGERKRLQNPGKRKT